MEKLKDLNEIKHKLIEAVESELAEGIQNVDTAEMGEVIDMIKDLAEAEKDCMKAAYYENVTEAMGEYEENERAGYDRWRYSSGRFAPKGRGTYGYVPMHTDMPMTTDGRTMPYDGKNVRYGYTTTDKHQKPSERLDGAIDMMGDIWAESDHDTKVKMKGLVRDLLAEMENSGV